VGEMGLLYIEGGNVYQHNIYYLQEILVFYESIRVETSFNVFNECFILLSNSLKHHLLVRILQRKRINRMSANIEGLFYKEMANKVIVTGEYKESRKG
jgi:hypothetical protein